jgi:hypothetical protein
MAEFGLAVCFEKVALPFCHTINPTGMHLVPCIEEALPAYGRIYSKGRALAEQQLSMVPKKKSIVSKYGGYKPVQL